MVLQIPSNLKLINSKRNNLLVVKGPFGKIKLSILDKINVENGCLLLKGRLFNFHFLFKNLFDDLSFGFEKKLELKGIGYQVFFNEPRTSLVFKLGYSHLIRLKVPKETWVRIKNKREISIKSFNRLHVISFVSKIRKLRRRSKYKHKGIFFAGEIYKLKSGKQVS